MRPISGKDTMTPDFQRRAVFLDADGIHHAFVRNGLI